MLNGNSVRDFGTEPAQQVRGTTLAEPDSGLKNQTSRTGHVEPDQTNLQNLPGETELVELDQGKQIDQYNWSSTGDYLTPEYTWCSFI